MALQEPSKLLILSQVILSLQLSFAIVPARHVHGRQGQDGRARCATLGDRLAVLIAVTVITLNVKLLWDFVARSRAGYPFLATFCAQSAPNRRGEKESGIRCALPWYC
jgi:hypothetical protein